MCDYKAFFETMERFCIVPDTSSQLDKSVFHNLKGIFLQFFAKIKGAFSQERPINMVFGV